MRARATLALGLWLTALAAGKKGSAEPDGKDRMRVEIDAQAEQAEPPAQSSEMAAEEAAALAGMEKELSDALTDIMAVLKAGSEDTKVAAVERLVHMAVATAEHGPDQARKFRSAVVAGGALPALVALLGSSHSMHSVAAAAAMHALALDDPATDADNFHQLEICQAGAVPALVKLLSATGGEEAEHAQFAATAALSALAENPTCQQMIAAEGAIKPLLKAATYGTDMHKLNALAALDVLELGNERARKTMKEYGAPQLLKGLNSMGASMLREQAGSLGARLSEPGASVDLDAAAHVKAARATRVKYDGVRQRAFRMMQTGAPRGP